MATTRTYGEGCAAAHALDLVGDRWALLVVRELVLGPKRFTDLRTGLCHASPNVLAQRLRELEPAGVVQRRRLPPPASCQVYELTPWGQELAPVLTALGQWGARSPGLPEVGMSVDSHVLALAAMFDADAAGDLCATYELRLGEHGFRISIADGRIEAARGAAERPDATIATDPDTFAALVWRGGDLAQELRAGTVTIEGDRTLAKRFLRLFPLPEPVAAPAVA